MARVQALQGSFVTGEISPRLQGNVLLESYKSSLGKCLNYVVVPQGAVTRRPGTRYVTTTKNDAAVRLIPFNYGQAQSYVIEAGAGYFRFFTADGVLMTGSSSSTPLEVTVDSDGDAVPYAVGDLDDLDVTQSADTLFIAHPSYRPYTLKRTGTYTWVFAKLDLKHGPFDPVNVEDTVLHVDMTSGSLDKERMTDIIQTSDYIDTTNERFTVTKHPFVNGQKIYFESSSSLPSGISVGPATQYFIINATVNTFQASTTYEGSPVNVTATGSGTLTIWKEFIPKDTTITLTSYILLSDITFTQSDDKFNKTSHGYANGTKMRFVKTAPDGFTVETIYYVISTATNDFQLSASEGGSAVTASGSSTITVTTLHAVGILGINDDTGFQSTDVNRYIRLNNEIYPHIRWGYAQITSRTSTSVVTAKVQEPLANEYTTSEWALGAFSGTSGYPRTVQIYQQRMVFAGTTSEPQNIYFSKTGDFNNFATTESLGKDSGDVDSTGAKIITEQIFNDNAITLQISSDTVDLIEWLNEDARLLIGTSGGIFQVYGSDTDNTLTPFNFTIQKITDWPSEDTALPQKIGNNLLYVQQNGRKVRELIFDNEQERYSADDISIRSENLTQYGIDELAYQDQPHALLWCRKADGKLACCTYVRNQQVIGWHQHQIGGTHTEATSTYGTHAKVERMVSIPRTNYDQMWFVVKRSINLGTVTANASTDKLTLNGHGMADTTRVRFSTTDTLPAGLSVDTDYYVRDTETNAFKISTTSGGSAVNITDTGTGTHTVKMMDRRYVEYMDKFYDSSETDANAAHFLDGGAIYSGGSTSSITGLGYLEGESVSIYGDGAAQPNQTVASGAITLQLAVTRAHVGLSFNSDVQTLPLAIGTADNTSVGNQKRIHRIIVRFHESMSLSYGMDSSNLTDATFRRGGDQLSSALDLFSGDKELVFPSNYDTLGQAYLRCSQPFPSTITLLALDYETND